MKKTTSEIIRNRKVRQPSRFVNGLLRILVPIIYINPCSVKFIRNVDLKKYKNKPVIIVVNHASRFDFAFVDGVMKYRRINFVAAENEFHRTKFKFAFTIARNIPKRNYVSDISTIRSMAKILRKTKNGCVAIFPCGLSTVSGAQQPSMSGTGKMLKHFGVDVLAVRIHGAYLVCPKYELTNRKGHVEVELDALFTPEQLQNMTEEEIDRKVDEALYTDDYEWNASRQNSYRKRNRKYAEVIEQILYKCPKCGTEMEMESKDDKIYCKHCGNAATIDDKYNITPVGDSVIPYNQREWFDWERREMRRTVTNPDFVMQEHVTLTTLPDYGYIGNNKLGNVVGDGTLRLDAEGVSYNGTRDGKPFELFIPSSHIPTVVLPVDGSFFYTYASGEFLLFTPDTASSVRWQLAIEEVYRENGGKWKNFPWFDYDKQGFETKKKG